MMDIIYECAQKYSTLLNKQYIFTVSHNWKTKTFALDFRSNDFRHIAGLQYVDDISIERNPEKVLDAALNGSITDAILNKSKKYKQNIRDGSSPEIRVYELQHLEKYLDSSDHIRIDEMQPFGSWIKAEYFIEAINPETHTAVYIFIRKRVENDNYVIVSFFKKTNPYRGTNLYWMVKLKCDNGKIIELYRKPSYIEDSNK